MEVRLEQGTMASRETSSLFFGVQKSPVRSQPPAMQSLRLAYVADGTAIFKPITSSSPAPPRPSPPPYQGGDGGENAGAGDGSSAVITPHGLNINVGEPVKRKRGRPRKYGPDGLALNPLSTAASVLPVAGAFSPRAGMANPADATKKPRGRPPGSGNKKQKLGALGSSGTGFTPHVITVTAGEDVFSKIMSFSQHGSRAICILSANGAISNVTLRQPATSGGTVTYEGRFEILSLSGSFLLSESGGQRSRTGGLSVSLAGPDGRVLGGGVAGLLMAASPVQLWFKRLMHQDISTFSSFHSVVNFTIHSKSYSRLFEYVVMGSFIPDGKKGPKQINPVDPTSAPGKLAADGMTGASSPLSRGTMSEYSGGPGSPLNQSTPVCNNSNQQGLSNIPWK
ncbi:AT-hook motif nuclear-localized protein 10-like isoform X1 [Musa acuminata AAA Group]|uniref:AT-hook motif nuclear-localized protein 10-like isoform X1 n=1 Tax=Musa acuminata AAA Group TaxID=214697 RepID=UPI0031DBB01C